MKLWASAPLIGLSVAALATACSDAPTNDNQFMGTAGTPPTTGGTGTSGTGTTMAGNGTGGSVVPGGGNPSGGNVSTSGAGGLPPSGGTGGAGPMGGTGGTGGGAPSGDCPAGVLGHCTAGMTYPPYPGYTLVLNEDFNAPIDLNTDPIWTWSDGSPESGQTGFREQQISFADGHMVITAALDAGCTASTTNTSCVPPRTSYGEAHDPNPTAQVGAMGVWSGELRTKYNNYRYGHYETKFSAPLGSAGQATMDNQAGFLSTMFIFRTPKNLVWNEVDIELEPNNYNHYKGNVVNAKNAGGYPAGNASPIDIPIAGGTYAISQEHVYAFDWTPTKVEWFLDGKSVTSFAGTGADPIPTLSAKIMMNLWIFSGPAFGPGAMNQYPMKASYDYFRYYKLDSEMTYPCSPTPGCLPAADKTKSSQNNPKEMMYGM